MPKENFYAEKPFTMVSDAEGLIEPYGHLYYADRGFLTFELLFFYYFIYDYQIYSKLDPDLRGKILNTFIEKIQVSRSDDFHNLKAIDKFYEIRIFTYFTITQEIHKMGEFSERCANYINTILTYSEEKNVFTCHSLDQARSELQTQIKPDQYTNELRVLLTLSSSPLILDGIDTTENVKKKSNNWFIKWFIKWFINSRR